MSRDEAGQATVELALCLPLVVIVLAAVVQVGAIAVDHVKVWHAAREGARLAAVDPDVAAIRRAAERSGLEPLRIAVEPEEIYRRHGEPVMVTIEYAPSTRIPVIGELLDHLMLRAEATMRIEQP